MRTVLDRLAAELRGVVDTFVLLDEIDSTHAMALRLTRQLDDEGQEIGPTVIVASRQTQGRGRSDRTWLSPPGGLYLNWLRYGLDAGAVATLPMLAAASAQAAVSELGIGGVGIKWPNDLVVGGSKLAGILTHARHGEPSWATVGLGVNVASRPSVDELAALPATCVADHLPPGDPLEWGARLAIGFLRALAQALEDPAPALQTWRDTLLLRPGQPIMVRLGGGVGHTGTFEGVTPEGFLRLRTAGEVVVIPSGELVETDP